MDEDNNELQDMGLSGMDIQIVGRLTNVDDDTSTSHMNKLSRFLQEDQATTGYTKGRFGIRLDYLPQFNVVPTSTYGLMIRSCRWSYEGEFLDKANFIINLSLGGDLTSAI